MPILKQGSSGPDVTDLQQKLKDLGFDPNGVDGNFGPGTRDAVIAFQQSKGLQADGIARAPSPATVERTILPGARLEESAEQMFNFGGEALITGYIRFETVGDTSGVVGFLDYGTASGPGLSALEARAEGSSDMLLSPVAEGSDYWTALALLNLRP